ncbi:MAG: class I SAM-dependent methyltransferase family protein [Candidatus Altiarchaeota archaeon]
MYAKIEVRRAESVKNIVMDSGVWDNSRKVIREKGFVLFPVKEKIEVDGVEFVEREGPLNERAPTSLLDSLRNTLSEGELPLVPSSFDIIGDIAIIDLPEGLLPRKNIVGEALIKTFKNVKVVLMKTGKVDSEYRVPSLQVIAGEDRTWTIHSEHGLRYRLDVAKAYFSPRLSGERMRVARQARPGERVLVMFAGVGPYAILISRVSGCEVHAVELNPDAVEFMRKNVLMSKTSVSVYCGDVRDVVPSLGTFDRIVMPLPKDAGSFMDIALPALNTGGVVHYYVFAESSIGASGDAVESAGILGVAVEVLDVVECGSFSPGVSRYCVDFKLK